MKRILPSIIVAVLLVVGYVGRHFSDKGNRSELNEISQLYLSGIDAPARSRMEAYLAKYPDDDLAWTIMGNMLEDNDLDAEAEDAYCKAIELNGDNFQAINAMGVLSRKNGDYDAAMDYYHRALDIEPDYAQAYSSMAVIELKRTNDVEALRLARLGYDRDKSDPVIAANLAVVHHYNGNMQERDRLTKIAESLGYKNVDLLQQIYNGEMTVRDD